MLYTIPIIFSLKPVAKLLQQCLPSSLRARYADKPLAKMLPECLILNLQHLLHTRTNIPEMLNTIPIIFSQ